MRAGELIGRTIVDAHGRPVGVCTDIRCEVREGSADTVSELTLSGLLVSRRHTGSLLGYERGRTEGPWLVSALVRWLHRGLAVVRWEDVADVPEEHDRDISLRPGAQPQALD